ncbi:MAG: lipopolysaccharide biosynthesis protein [bacterium]
MAPKLRFGRLPFRNLCLDTLAGRDGVLHAVLTNGGWAVAGQAVHALVTLAETLLLARFLSMDMFGVFVILASTAELIFGALDFRTGEAVIKFVPELQRSRGHLAVSAFMRMLFLLDGTVAILGFAVIVFAGSFIMQWLALPTQYTIALAVLGGTVALKTMVRSIGSFLRVTNSFALSIKLGMAAMVLRLVVLTVTLVTAPAITTVSKAFACSESLFFALSIAAAVGSFRALDLNPLRPAGHLLTQERKSITNFLFSTNLAGAFRILSTKLDVIVIAGLSSPAVVALYKVSTRIAGALMLFSDPLLLAIYPQMAQLHAQNDNVRLTDLVILLAKIMAIIAALLIVLFACFGNWLLGTLAGARYVEVQPVTLVMLLGTSLSMIFFWARPLLLVYGMASKVVLVALVALIFQFVCLYVMVPTLGVQGAGLAFTLYYGMMVFLFLYFLLRRTGFVFFQAKTSSN